MKLASSGAMAGSHMILCSGAIRKASPPHGMCRTRPFTRCISRTRGEKLQHLASIARRWTTWRRTVRSRQCYPRSLTPSATLLTLCRSQAHQSEGRQRENARPHTPDSGLYGHHGMGETASSRASALMVMCVSTAMAAIQHQPAEKGTPVQPIKGSRPPLQQKGNDWQDIVSYSSLVL